MHYISAYFYKNSTIKVHIVFYSILFISLVVELTYISIKKEMSNFRYDDVLLKWEITGTGRCVGSYSHFNSMMKRSIQAE